MKSYSYNEKRDILFENKKKKGNKSDKKTDSPDCIDEEVYEGIEESGSVVVSDSNHCIHCLTIIGEIEGHIESPPQNKTTKYEHVIPRLVAIEEDEKTEGLLVILNTVGGDIEAGLALAELMAGMEKPTVSLVLGGGHSIGVPLAVAAKYSFIAPSASMTIHPVRSNGITLGVRQSFEYFQRMQQRINNFVAANSNISAEKYNSLAMTTGELVMDVGTVLEGKSAVEVGLIDSVGSLSLALRKLKEMIDENRKAANEEKTEE